MGGLPRPRADAAEHARRSAARLRELRMGIVEAGDLGRAWTAQLEAEISLLEGCPDCDLWQRAVEAWDATGQVHEQAWALVKLARCMLASPTERRSAGTVLQAAQAIGIRLGAGPVLEAVSEVAGRARLDITASTSSSTGARSHPQGLTAREIQVLQCVAMGLSNDQIADELFISPKTASVHVSHILRKLDVRSRSEATTSAHRLHLLVDLRDA
jgi:DNA-binding NarL/FixJ family response regulator